MIVVLLCFERKNHQYKNQFLEAFGNVIDPNIVTLFIIEEWVCQLYGHRKLEYIDKARVVAFCKSYKLNNKEETFKITGRHFDGPVLPPSKAELKQHILRDLFL